MDYRVRGADELPSPALIYYKDVIVKNTLRTIGIAGGAQRLWPHMKTHKTGELLDMQRAYGITRVKCATVNEAILAAEHGMEHILWAYPLVGPNIGRYFDLVKRFENAVIYGLVDDRGVLGRFSDEAVKRGMTAKLFIDVNMGMDRTGVPYRMAEGFLLAARELPGIEICGLHCYDGHIHDTDFDERCAHVRPASDEMTALGRRYGLMMIMGGTPSFPCHALEEGVFLSPGTLFVSDHGYRASFPDVDVVPAAAVLSRVISHPADGLFTLDAGTKAVSADPRGPRGVIAGMEDVTEDVLSSEEHWVFRMKEGHERPAIGTELYIIPTHICTTTCLYDAVYVAENGAITGKWQVAARDRTVIL